MIHGNAAAAGLRTSLSPTERGPYAAADNRKLTTVLFSPFGHVIRRSASPERGEKQYQDNVMIYSPFIILSL